MEFLFINLRNRERFERSHLDSIKVYQLTSVFIMFCNLQLNSWPLLRGNQLSEAKQDRFQNYEQRLCTTISLLYELNVKFAHILCPTIFFFCSFIDWASNTNIQTKLNIKSKVKQKWIQGVCTHRISTQYSSAGATERFKDKILMWMPVEGAEDNELVSNSFVNAYLKSTTRSKLPFSSMKMISGLLDSE